MGSDGDLFAIGGPDGEMLRFHDGLWIAEGAPFEGDSQDIWAASSEDVSIVDGEGYLYIFDGEDWLGLAPPIAAMQGRNGFADLLGVWCSSPDDVFVVGHGGLVLRTSGGNWSLQETPTTEVLEAIWDSSADDVYAVGWRGTIIHYDGARWTHAAASRSSE